MDEWFPWTGGICPVDVDQDVVYMLRNGWISDAAVPAGIVRWDHGRTLESPSRQNDIIAYRLYGGRTGGR